MLARRTSERIVRTVERAQRPLRARPAAQVHRIPGAMRLRRALVLARGGLTERRAACDGARLVTPKAASLSATTRRFEDFVRAHEQMLLAMATKLCGSPADARDLVQDTFERALRSYDQLPPGSNDCGWAVTILHNLFIDRCRKRRREPRQEDIDEVPVAAPEPPPAPPAWSHITDEQLRAALQQIGEEFRVVYQLHAIDGRSYKEIAAELALPMATVGTRLNRARRKLRELLEGALGPAPEMP